jgi:hypothetical protein
MALVSESLEIFLVIVDPCYEISQITDYLLRNLCYVLFSRQVILIYWQIQVKLDANIIIMEFVEFVFSFHKVKMLW